MAFNPAPQTWLGLGYTLAASNVKLTTATAGGNIALPQLTDTEANATTGDIREVVFAIMEALSAAWTAQAPADRPVEMTIQKTASNVVAGKVTYNYSVSINATILTENVTPEP